MCLRSVPRDLCLIRYKYKSEQPDQVVLPVLGLARRQRRAKRAPRDAGVTVTAGLVRSLAAAWVQFHRLQDRKTDAQK
jgi:hypothetical protein